MQVFKASVIRGFKNWSNFSGRASRSEYWYLLLSMYLLIFLGGLVASDSYLGVIIYMAYLIPLIAAAFRRMHDTGHSGLWVIVPIVGLVFACTKSDPMINKYGAPSPPLP